MPGNLGYRTNAAQNMSPGAGMPPVQGGSGMPMSMAPYSRAQMGGGTGGGGGMPQAQMMQPPPGMGMPQQGAQGGGQNPLAAMLQNMPPELLQRFLQQNRSVNQDVMQRGMPAQDGPQNIMPGLLSGMF